MPANKKLVSIGKKKIVELINEMELSRAEISKRIGLSKGGLYHITHRSGKMEFSNWIKFKKEYSKITGKEIKIDEQFVSTSLEESSLEDLLEEITNRGWEVVIKSRSK